MEINLHVEKEGAKTPVHFYSNLKKRSQLKSFSFVLVQLIAYIFLKICTFLKFVRKIRQVFADITVVCFAQNFTDHKATKSLLSIFWTTV